MARSLVLVRDYYHILFNSEYLTSSTRDPRLDNISRHAWVHPSRQWPCSNSRTAPDSIHAQISISPSLFWSWMGAGVRVYAPHSNLASFTSPFLVSVRPRN